MWRAYFIIGDFLTCTITGAVAAVLVHMATPADWFMPLGMFAGMAIGMAVAMLGLFVFSPLFGALEVVLPMMLTAMAAGMGAGMSVTMESGLAEYGWREAAEGGTYTGMTVFAFTYFLQAINRGEIKFRGSE